MAVYKKAAAGAADRAVGRGSNTAAEGAADRAVGRGSNTAAEGAADRVAGRGSNTAAEGAADRVVGRGSNAAAEGGSNSAAGAEVADQAEVDFGFERVSPAEKTRRVAGVFSSVAKRYDLMNDLMSFGTHRLMKRMLMEMSGLRSGNRHLDLAGGTGDIAKLASPIVGDTGQVVLADINAEMLEVGRERLLDAGITNARACQANAEYLPFADNQFDCVTIGFGLRNVTDKDRALREMCRVLRPGGVLLVLEFSHIENPVLRGAYQGFQALWPSAGKALVGDAESYKYLVESIRVHPKQNALKLMIKDAGFTDASVDNLVGGAAAIHRGIKPAN